MSTEPLAWSGRRALRIPGACISLKAEVASFPAYFKITMERQDVSTTTRKARLECYGRTDSRIHQDDRTLKDHILGR